MSQGIQENPIKTQEIQNTWTKALATGTTSLIAGGAILALEGAAVVSPVGIGIAVASGVNALSSTAIAKLIGSDDTLKTQFFRLCASVAAVALSALALPYAAVALSSYSFFALSLEVAVAIGIADVVTKITALTAYQVGSWVTGSFRFPASEEGIQNLSKDKLKQSRASFEEKRENFIKLPLNLQVAFNKQLVDEDQKPLPLAFTELGDKWAPESLAYLATIDHSGFTVEQQKEVNTLLFKENVLPQERDYTANVLPEFNPKGAFSKEQAHWVRVHYVLTEQVVPTEVAEELYKAKLPPVGKETFALKTPETIEKLSPTDVKWHFNNFQANPALWKTLSSAQQKAFIAKFSENELALSKLPKSYQVIKERMAHTHIPWKKVGVVALFSLVILAPTAGLWMMLASSNANTNTADPNGTCPDSVGPLLNGRAQPLAIGDGLDHCPATIGNVTASHFQGPAASPVFADRTPKSATSPNAPALNTSTNANSSAPQGSVTLGEVQNRKATNSDNPSTTKTAKKTKTKKTKKTKTKNTLAKANKRNDGSVSSTKTTQKVDTAAKPQFKNTDSAEDSTPMEWRTWIYETGATWTPDFVANLTPNFIKNALKFFFPPLQLRIG